MNAFQRAGAYLNRYGLLNFIRKSAYLLLRIFFSILQFYRKLWFYVLTRCWVNRISGKISVSGLVHDAHIGKDATIYPGTLFEFSENAHLQIGDHFVLSYGSLIACHRCITIGNHVMIGEYTSIRDTTHNYQSGEAPYSLQPDYSQDIEIGNNVWIGRGCIILPGTVIEEGVIVGANSVVKGRLQANWLYSGVPAHPIKPLRIQHASRLNLSFTTPPVL